MIVDCIGDDLVILSHKKRTQTTHSHSCRSMQKVPGVF